MYTIYGLPTCTFCHKAVALLEEKGLPHSYVDLEDEHNLEAYVMLHKSVPKTVPQVYYNDERIGGYDKLSEYLDTE